VLTHRSEGERTSAPLTTASDPAQHAPDVRQRIAELRAIKTWQDQLVQSLTTSSKPPADRLWRMVACAYLPPGRISPAVIAHAPSSAEEPEPPPLMVVSWQRTTRRGDHTTALEFKQFTDGSVHIEQRITAKEEETITRLDAASWDVLREQHGELCRELGLFDPEKGTQAAWPLPARGHIERDAQRVLRGDTAPTGLAMRLLTLQLAQSVKGPEELAAAMQQVLHRPWPSVTPPINTGDVAEHQSREPLTNAHVEELRALEQATGAARYPDAEWKLAMRCLTPPQQPSPTGRSRDGL
jgi:hypothetical protein